MKNQADFPNNKNDSVNFNKYKEILTQIAAEKIKLSGQLRTDIDMIHNKAHDIIQCMIDDARDISSGTQFLDRYLSTISSTITRLANTTEYIQETPSYTQFIQQAQKIISNLRLVFEQMHQQLLENDADDLVVELKMLDKLLQSEGLHTNQ